MQKVKSRKKAPELHGVEAFMGLEIAAADGPLWDEEDNKATLRKIGRAWVIVIEGADGTRNEYRFTTKGKAIRWAQLAGVELETEPEETVSRSVYYEGFGEKHTAAQWARLLNVSDRILRRDIKNGLTIKEIAKIRKSSYAAK